MSNMQNMLRMQSDLLFNSLYEQSSLCSRPLFFAASVSPWRFIAKINIQATSNQQQATSRWEATKVVVVMGKRSACVKYNKSYEY